MDWYLDLNPLLANPSIENWKRIVIIGNRVLKAGEEEAVRLYLVKVANRLATWPTELTRAVPKHWPLSWQQKLGNTVREIQTYNTFILGICTHPMLQLSNGMQAVQLTRRFVGMSSSLAGNLMSVGMAGEADLEGGLSVEFKKGIVEFKLEVEIKSAGAVLNAEQKQHKAAVQRRGRIYIVAQTVETAVQHILIERTRVLAVLSSGV